jgi:hypothetical protein
VLQLPDLIQPYSMPHDIPETVQSLADIPEGLFLPSGTASSGARCRAIHDRRNGIEAHQVRRGSLIRVQPGRVVQLGKRLGQGRQGVIFQLENYPKACAKIGKNVLSRRQFRREILGFPWFRYLGIPCPKLHYGDSEGTLLLKETWADELTTGTDVLAQYGGALPPERVLSLHRFVEAFECHGLCPDCLPENLVWSSQGWGSVETTLWRTPPVGKWSFTTCFLIAWLPGFDQPIPSTFPPYQIPRSLVRHLEEAWRSADHLQVWRDCFGVFPSLNPIWWNVV